MRLDRFSMLFSVLLIPVLAVEASEFFNVVKVAEGVYAAIGKPGVLSNAGFIITDEGVVVVDTHLRPLWAKDLIAEIGKLTDRPVRYVINTHWHNDHTQGNRAYMSAFPSQTEFIAHHRTREDIIGKAVPNLKRSLEDMPGRIAQMKEQLARGTRADGAPLSDSLKMVLERQIASQESYLDELRSLEITLPNLTFERSLLLWIGGRQIQVLYFGEGHTRGDVFVYLPKEKVLMSGDMLTGGVPFMRDAVPLSWAPTLESVGKLDFEVVIPGHGDVQKGKDRLNLVVRYLNDLVHAVREQVERGAALEEATKGVGEKLAPAYEKEFPGFRQSLAGPNGNVAKVYEALTSKQ